MVHLENGIKKRGSGAQRIYDSLRHSILCLERKPGESLDEASLSQEFGMSRSPVREALIRLSADGLVVILPNKSTQVAPLNMEQSPAYFDALDIVQRYTTRLSAKLRTADDLATITAHQDDFKTALQENNISAMIEANRRFHMAISVTAQNPYFDILHKRLLDEGRRMLHLYFLSFEHHIPPSIGHDHDLIIDAIANQDCDMAEKLAHDHVVQVKERYLHYLSRSQSLDFNLSPHPKGA